MKNNKLNNQNSEERGFVLAGILFIIGIGAVISVGMLNSAQNTAKTRAIVKNRSLFYYEVEQTLNSAVVWLQDHSQDMATLFKKADFDNHFTLGNPTYAANEGAHFQTPTMVKISGTNDAPMLSNNSFFGTSNFPGTTNIINGDAFDPVASFNSAGIGPANARIVMIWAREAGSEYEPVFRIDVLTGNNPDRGVHSFSYVYSKLVGGGSIPGFFGRDLMETGSPNNQCSSFEYTNDGTGWARGAAKANCTVGSNGPVNIKSQINGQVTSAQSGGITFGPHGESNSTCEGSSCPTIPWPNPGNFSSLCGTGQNIGKMSGGNHTWDQNHNPATGARPAHCYMDVEFSNNTTLTLTDYRKPYYFSSLDIGNGELKFGPIPLTDTDNIDEDGDGNNDDSANWKYVIYVDDLDGGTINGNQLIGGPPLAPHQVKIIYTGTSLLKMNGNADLFALVEAPYASVDVRGNFSFNGGVQAVNLTVGGNTRLNYTENAQTAIPLADVAYVLKKASQRYR